MHPNNISPFEEKLNKAIERIMITSGIIGYSWFLIVVLVGMYAKL
jgi:hypothetical protein